MNSFTLPLPFSFGRVRLYVLILNNVENLIKRSKDVSHHEIGGKRLSDIGYQLLSKVGIKKSKREQECRRHGLSASFLSFQNYLEKENYIMVKICSQN